MATTIKLKNSVVLGKAPTIADIAVGELALNCNAGSPAAYIQDSAGSIVQLAGTGSVPDASETVKGIAQIATTVQVTAGTDDTTIITPAKLTAAIPAAQDLQSVCNEGATTTTGATFNGTVTANLFSGPLPYSDLTGTPTIPTNNNQLTNGAGYITSADGGDADKLDGQEGSYYLDYGNFTNTPTIPTNNNQLTNGAGYITSADGGDADKLDGQEGSYYLDYANFTSTPTIPTNNNQLTNGASYITISSVPTNNNQLTNGAGYYKSGDSPSFATVTATGYSFSSLPTLP